MDIVKRIQDAVSEAQPTLPIPGGWTPPASAAVEPPATEVDWLQASGVEACSIENGADCEACQ